MSFHVGQKVVCIHGNWSKNHQPRGVIWPEQGQTYTIAAIFLPMSDFGPYVFHLQEIPHRYGIWEVRLASSSFRPLCETKTDISIFLAMLKPQRKAVKEKA